MNKLKLKLGIDDKLTKVRPGKKLFNKVKDNIPLVEHYNYMADLMFLPTDKFGFKYLLVVVDLANDEFDIEPLKNKESKHVLDAFQKMFKRPYLNKPEYSLTTDGGGEFSGVFQKYLFDESIFHKVTRKGRHKQLGNIDNLIRQLSILLVGLMNKEEMRTKRQSKTWVKYVNDIRKLLNEIRVKQLPDDDYIYPSLTTSYTEPEDGKKTIYKRIKPKFKVGDLVHVMLDSPENALGNQQQGKFREADNRYTLEPLKIKQILLYSGKPLHRYLVEGIKNVSFTESEMFLA